MTENANQEWVLKIKQQIDSYFKNHCKFNTTSSKVKPLKVLETWINCLSIITLSIVLLVVAQYTYLRCLYNFLYCHGFIHLQRKISICVYNAFRQNLSGRHAYEIVNHEKVLHRNKSMRYNTCSHVHNVKGSTSIITTCLQAARLALYPIFSPTLCQAALNQSRPYMSCCADSSRNSSSHTAGIIPLMSHSTTLTTSLRLLYQGTLRVLASAIILSCINWTSHNIA